MPTTYTAVITSDRYSEEQDSLAPELEILAEFPDLRMDLRVEHFETIDDLVRLGNEADALFLSTRDAVPREALERIERARVIARYGVGLDNVDLDAAADQGIVITHFPQYCMAEVADHAVSLVLALNRRLIQLDSDIRDGAWGRHGSLTSEILRGPVKALRESRLGLVGLGRIGEKIASRLAPFGVEIVVNDPYIDASRIHSVGAQSMEFDDLISTADIIVLITPLTPDTRGLLGREQFDRMRSDVIIVNTSRGPVIDQSALVDFLRTHPMAQAGLDVFEEEPLDADSPLCQLPNVVLTPHSAYYSERSVQILRDETFRSAIDVLRGIQPPTIANPRVLEKVDLHPREQ